MTLDEILREEERLLRVHAGGREWDGCLIGFYSQHGPTLAAVARAGDRLYDYAHHASICTGDSTRPCDCGLVEALAAWDVAAAPQEPKTTDGGRAGR